MGEFCFSPRLEGGFLQGQIPFVYEIYVFVKLSRLNIWTRLGDAHCFIESGWGIFSRLGVH